MPTSFIGLPPDSTGKKIRSRQRTEGANTVEEQFFIPTTERVVQCEVMTSTWRTLGAAAVTHNIFTLENTAGSAVVVALRRLSVQLDATAVLTSVAPTVNLYRTTALPTGGTVLAKTMFDTNETSAANVVARSATASNGGAATAITATPVAGTAAWGQFTMRIATAVGQIVMDDQSLVPTLAQDTPMLIRPGQAILAQVVASVATSNPVTNHWVINALWEEVTFP